VSDRVKFYACPNDEHGIHGGGEYQIFSNSVPDPHNCVPIYLGAKGLIGILLRGLANGRCCRQGT